jgi:hypothetical protein
MKTQPISRRSLAAGLALAPVATFPVVAGAGPSAPLSTALAQAIERHRAANAAVNVPFGEEDVPEHLIEAETEALWDLANAPSANDGELLAKLRYLVAYEKSIAMGQVFDMSLHGSLAIALDLHFNPEA